MGPRKTSRARVPRVSKYPSLSHEAAAQLPDQMVLLLEVQANRSFPSP